MKAIPKNAEDLHELSKLLADQKKNRGRGRHQLLNGIRGRSFMITLDSKQLSEFTLEMKADFKQAKETLLRLLMAFTVAVYMKGSPSPSPKSFLADRFIKLLDAGCKTVPRLNSDARVLAELPQDEQLLDQMADKLTARPRIEMLPDLLATVFNNQRCTLMGEIEEKRLVGSVFAQSPGDQQSELYTAFVMAVFTAAEQGLPLSSLWELLGVASVLLVPIFSAGEKTKIFMELKNHVGYCQRAAYRAARETASPRASPPEPWEDGISEDLVENHFEQVEPSVQEESTLQAEEDEDTPEEFVFIADENGDKEEEEAAACVLQ